MQNFSAHFVYPTLRKEREGWGTRTFDIGQQKDSALMGLARLYAPTYAGANMGHPFRVGLSGIVVYRNSYLLSSK
jgi:hypothetical protein